MRRVQEPFPYIERNRRNTDRKGIAPYQWAVNQDAPWTPMVKPMTQCRVGLVSTAGIFCIGQEPFNTDGKELSFREVPVDTPKEMLAIRHGAYDETHARKDINVVFPVDRLREMARVGEIGGLAPHALSLVGRIYSRRRVTLELAPPLLERLRRMQADVALVVPV